MLIMEMMQFADRQEKRLIALYAKNELHDCDEKMRLYELETAMAEEVRKYGLHWWLVPYPQVKAFFQSKTNVLIISLKEYERCLRITLGRRVNGDEIFRYNPELMEEVEGAAIKWARKHSQQIQQMQ